MEMISAAQIINKNYVTFMQGPSIGIQCSQKVS